MKLTNKYQMSRWAFWQCKNGNDTPEMRSLLTHSRCAYEYCKYIKNREELWQYIKNKQAFDYCQHIEDRKEFWSNMFNKWAYWYCYYYTDRDIIWKNITRIKWAYLYCKRVKDRPELRKLFKEKDSFHYWVHLTILVVD